VKKLNPRSSQSIYISALTAIETGYLDGLDHCLGTGEASTAPNTKGIRAAFQAMLGKIRKGSGCSARKTRAANKTWKSPVSKRQMTVYGTNGFFSILFPNQLREAQGPARSSHRDGRHWYLGTENFLQWGKLSEALCSDGTRCSGA
jgi:hypothetical protein